METNLLVSLNYGCVGHRVRAVEVDREKGIKAIYCLNDQTLIKYLFRKNKGWDEKGKAIQYAQTHLKSFSEFKELRVDQAREFIKVIGTDSKGNSVEFAPNPDKPAFILEANPTEKVAFVMGESQGATTLHSHTVELDPNGNGITSEDDGHVHSVSNFVVQGGGFENHSHKLASVTQLTDDDISNIATSGWTLPEGRDSVPGRVNHKVYDGVALEETLKFNEEKRLVYGVFLWPEKADHDGDVISAEDIEKVAHGFMADYRTIDEMHKQVIDADIVESGIAWIEGMDFHGKKLAKGVWFGAVKINNDAVWEKVKQGVYKGFSVRISGVREPIGE